ncbi:hypothetical protein TRICI_001645 [Trichomonascus ciferrii]|uniref:Uncharacterized protein n=1 Tax=Trichomonascus ciferrii TaxID=44093 RepID=A0A642V7Y7_9ASCO|nr:hypothetical protein TRICI_001645 [Trichomonascus ciferrii]
MELVAAVVSGDRNSASQKNGFYAKLGEADPGGLGRAPRNTTAGMVVFFSRKEAKAFSSALQKGGFYPKLGEADPGGLGACPQKTSCTGDSAEGGGAEASDEAVDLVEGVDEAYQHGDEAEGSAAPDEGRVEVGEGELEQTQHTDGRSAQEVVFDPAAAGEQAASSVDGHAELPQQVIGAAQ